MLAPLRGKNPLQHLEQQDHAQTALVLLLISYHCIALLDADADELEEDLMIVGPIGLKAVLLQEEVGCLDLVGEEEAIVLQTVVEEVVEVWLIFLQNGSVGQQTVVVQKRHLVF